MNRCFPKFASAFFLVGFIVLVLLSAICTHSQVVTWGASGSSGLTNIPPGLTNVVGLCAGNSHSVLLKADGRVVVWGDNFWGQTNVPTGATNVVAIAAALNHTVALRGNGTVVSWGDITNAPSSVTNAVAVAAGDHHNVVLRPNGTVTAWGTATAGTATNVPAGLSNVVAVAAGGNFSAALLGDGRVVRWGSSIIATGMTSIATLSGGVFTLVALRADGKVVAPSTGTVPASLSNVVAVAAGRYHGLALRSDGTVTNWTVSPATPAGLSNLTLIASGENHCLGLTASGPPFVTTRLVDRRAAPGSSVPFYSLAVGAWPLSYQWRLNDTNLPGATNAILALTNVLPGVHSGAYSVLVTNNLGSVTSSAAILEVTDFGPALNTSNLVWTSTGDAPWFVQTTNTHDGNSALQSGSVTNPQSSTVQTTVTGPGTLTFWWKVTNGQLVFQGGSGASSGISGTVNWQQKTIYIGSGNRTLNWTFQNGIGSGWLDEVTFEPGATAPIFTSAPASQSQGPGLSLTLSGGASGTPPIGYQWQFNGTNLPGATGGSLAILDLQPANAGIYTLVATNIAGTNYANASAEIGQVAAWPTPSSIQTIVPAGMTNIVAIAQGSQHSLVLRADGTVQAWDNMPVPAGISNIIAISSSAGAYHDVALKADGTVVAWGDTTWGNAWGQTDVPAGLSNVVAVAAGWSHGMALKSDGTVVAWGGSEGQAAVPEGLTNVVVIGAGSFHSLAVLEDGNVVVWGRTTNVPPELTNAIAVAAGWFYCTAVRADGRVVTWGDNAYGQTNVPTSLTNASRITAGWYHAFAATADGGLAACDNSSTVPAGLSNVLAVASGYYNNLALLGSAPLPLQVADLVPTVDANGFNVSLPTQSGRVYRLEYKNSLADTNWIALPLVPGNGGMQTLTDTIASNSQRFYRVRQW